MRKLLLAACAALFASAAFAGPVALFPSTTPLEPSQIQATLNNLIILMNAQIAPPVSTCTGTTTATCQGLRFVASVTGLTTAAAGTSSAAMTVTDATVTQAGAVNVVCAVAAYSGTGQPIVTNITPATGTVSFQITNVAASGALNATVPVFCQVFN